MLFRSTGSRRARRIPRRRRTIQGSRSALDFLGYQPATAKGPPVSRNSRSAGRSAKQGKNRDDPQRQPQDEHEREHPAHEIHRGREDGPLRQDIPSLVHQPSHFRVIGISGGRSSPLAPCARFTTTRQYEVPDGKRDGGRRRPACSSPPLARMPTAVPLPGDQKHAAIRTGVAGRADAAGAQMPFGRRGHGRGAFPRHVIQTSPGPSHPTRPCFPGLAGRVGRVSCAPLNSALVGAVRGRIRNCCRAYTRPGVRRKWAEHRVAS